MNHNEERKEITKSLIEAVEGVTEAVKAKDIFVGATFDHSDGDHITIKEVKPGKVYAQGDSFGFERKSKAEAAAYLNKEKYRYVGVE